MIVLVLHITVRRPGQTEMAMTEMRRLKIFYGIRWRNQFRGSRKCWKLLLVLYEHNLSKPFDFSMR